MSHTEFFEIGKKPWLAFPPQLAHDLAPKFLRLISKYKKQEAANWDPMTWNGLTFPNRLGVAGGVDKNAVNVTDWWKWGAGFVEVGTVTPKPQSANPPPLIKRDIREGALWNKLGFPNDGAQRILSRLETLQEHQTPIFVNIGKQRETPNEAASGEYVDMMKSLSKVADAFVVNISSPNTKGLRELLKPKHLESFLEPVVRTGSEIDVPALLKLSPDIDGESLKKTLEVTSELGISGFILTNTTVFRPQDVSFPSDGGLSGRPLATLSKNALKIAVETLKSRGKKNLLISVGGIMSPTDVQERLEMGADLVQCYSALVFEGPAFFRRTQEHFRKSR